MPRTRSRIWLEINLKAIQNNFKTIVAKVGTEHCSVPTVMPILKANAYGLGVCPIAQTLKQAGARFFGVAELHEALEINNNGTPVQILGAILEEEISDIIKNNIIAPICDRRTAHLLNLEACRQNKQATCHLLIDTGMGRLGMRGGHLPSVIEEICALPFLKVNGIYSHFPHAYGDVEFSQFQIKQFKYLLSILQKRGITFRHIHIANSDGINNIPESYQVPFTIVRTGINLYGVFDLQGNRAYHLQSALTLKSTLVAVRKLPAGTSIGYGKMYTLQKPSVVGTVSAGYADGLPFSLTNNGRCIIRDTECPMIGRISMDYTTILLDHAPNAQPGDEVILLNSKIPVAEWARKKGTHTYDIICSFGNRVERKYVASM